MELFIQLLQVLLPSIMVIVFMAIGYRIVKVRISTSGLTADLSNPKADRRGRSRVQIAERIREKQREIDRIEFKTLLSRSMRLAHEEMSLLKSAFVVYYQSMLSPLLSEQEMVIANDEGEVFTHATLWGKLMTKLKSILRESFELNGFKDLDDAEFSRYITRKKDLIKVECSTFWTKNWPVNTQVPQQKYCTNALNEMDSVLYESLYRLFSQVKDVHTVLTIKQKSLESEVEELMTELKEER